MITAIKKTVTTALLALVVWAAVPGPAFCQTARVAVFPFKNNGQSQYNGLSSGLGAMFTTDLTKSKDLEVVDPLRVSDALGRARLVGGAPAVEEALKAAAGLGADFAVTGEFVVFGGRFRIDARVYEVKTGALKASEKAQAKEDELFDMVDELSGRIIMAITGSMPVVGGSLQVTSEPPGAALRVDGEKAGQTPNTIMNITPGPHKVDVELEGYKSFSQTVTVNANEAVKVDVKLVRLYGGIRVWWKDFPTSDISIGSETIKVSQFQTNLFAKYCKNLPSGAYDVSVRMPYKDESSWENKKTWRTYAVKVDVNPGEVVDIFMDNNLFSPGIEVSACGSCAANWDFNTDIVWYEAQ